MKKIIAFCVALLISFPLVAQDEKSIIIEQNSFKMLESGALSNVNIDPISKDSSRRPCARIKVRINRMTKVDINGIEVKIATNNELKKCETADYDNGLIIEMTAKPETRFYFTHKYYGDSNEVTLNLEPNKEYYLEAYLNMLNIITIISDVQGADVYLDNKYRGQTESDYMCDIDQITTDTHTLRLEYNGKNIEQTIVVDRRHHIFRADLLHLFTEQKAPAEQVAPAEVTPAPAPTVPAPAAPKKPAVSEKKKEQKSEKESKEFVSKRRFEHSAELNYNIGEGMGVGVNYILGGRINNTLYLGLGLGAGWQQNPYSSEKLSFPLYGHIRTYFGKRRCQPFLSLSAGVKFANTGKQAGLYGNPSFGVNIRSKSGKNNAWYISAGYLIHQQAIFDLDKSTLFNGAKINVGITF